VELFNRQTGTGAQFAASNMRQKPQARLQQTLLNAVIAAATIGGENVQTNAPNASAITNAKNALGE
jgi:transcriptional/translational regulatory protein YebC/TACO1